VTAGEIGSSRHELDGKRAETPVRPLGNGWLLAPALFLLSIYFAAQVLFLYQSLLHAVPGGTAVVGPPGLENYRRFFMDSGYVNVLIDTLWISAELTAVVLCASYPLAYLIARTSSRALRSFILFAIVVTFLSGGVTRAYAWLILLGNRGLLNSLMQALGLTGEPLRLVYNRLGVFLSLVHFLLPFMVLTLVGPLRNVPRVLELAARDLGANGWRTFCAVTFPLSLPGVINAVALTYVVALSSFLFPLLLGGGRVRFMANLIYDQIFTAYDLPFAAAIAVIFLAVSLFAIIALGWLSRRVSHGVHAQ